jgi:hypothetical protein
MSSSTVTAAELFPFLGRQSFQPLEKQPQSTNKPQTVLPIFEKVEFRTLVTEDCNGSKVIYNQVCAQPEYEHLHPLQIRMQMEYKPLAKNVAQRVQQLLQEKQEMEIKRDREYRKLLFGLADG